MNFKAQNIVKAFLVVLMLIAPSLGHAAGDAIIAVVNDDVITMKDLRQYIAGVASQMRLEEHKTPEEIQQALGEYEQKGLDKLIDDKLILAAANDKGLTVNQEMIDKRMKEIKDRYPSDDEFIKSLNMEGMNVSDLEQRLTDQMKIKFEVDMEVRDKIMVNPQDVTDYYNKHMADFHQKPRVNLQSIFISYDKHSKQEARSLADEARSHLMAGEDFDKVAQKYSEGSSVGEVEQGQMTQSVEDVIFNLKLDEVSDSVEVANGIYVFKAIGISAAKQESLVEVKDQIYNKLEGDQFDARFKTWIDQLRQKAYVEIK